MIIIQDRAALGLPPRKCNQNKRRSKGTILTRIKSYLASPPEKMPRFAMTWKEAQEIAIRNIDALEIMWLEKGIDKASMKGSKCPIVDYETQHDYNTLRPEDGPKAQLHDHQLITRASARLLRQRFGLKTYHVTLRASDYLRWLASTGKTNDASTRAEFIGIQSQTPDQEK